MESEAVSVAAKLHSALTRVGRAIHFSLCLWPHYKWLPVAGIRCEK